MPRKAKSRNDTLVPVNQVQQHILLLRGQRIILDSHLARLYGVTTKRFNQQVKRNIDRFPDDFMFQLTWDEAESVRSQIATLNAPVSRSQIATLKHGRNVKYRPFAFTEHGAIMAATVLNSPLAVKASLFVVRAFVQLRELLSNHHQLAERLNELEHRLQNHDDQILNIIEAIRQLMEESEESESSRPPIGFHTEIDSPQGRKSSKPSTRTLPART